MEDENPYHHPRGRRLLTDKEQEALVNIFAGILAVGALVGGLSLVAKVLR